MKCPVVLVASALLLVQLTGALPHVKRESEDSSSELLSAQERLMIYTFTEIANLYKWVLENGSVVINNAVKELNEIPDKDDLLLANITRLSKIGSEVSQFKLEKDKKSFTKLLEYMISFNALIDDLENMPSDSKLKLTLKTAFDNNGYKKIEDQFLLKVDELFKNFDHAFVEYVKTLTSKEKVKQSRFFQWHEEFTAETNVPRKLEKFEELFV